MYYKRNKHVKLYFQHYQNHDRQAYTHVVTTTATTTAVKMALMVIVYGNDDDDCEW